MLYLGTFMLFNSLVGSFVIQLQHHLFIQRLANGCLGGSLLERRNVCGSGYIVHAALELLSAEMLGMHQVVPSPSSSPHMFVCT